MTFASGMYSNSDIQLEVTNRVASNPRFANVSVNMTFTLQSQPNTAIRSNAFVILEDTVYHFQPVSDTSQTCFTTSEPLQIHKNKRPDAFVFWLVYQTCKPDSCTNCQPLKTYRIGVTEDLSDDFQDGTLAFRVLATEGLDLSHYDLDESHHESEPRDEVELTLLQYMLIRLFEYGLGISSQDIPMTITSPDPVTEPVEPNQASRIKTIHGTVIFSLLEGEPYVNLGSLILSQPNTLILTIRDVSIADASSVLIRTFRFSNIKRLPYEYSLDISDIAFTRGRVYSISVHLDQNNNGELDQGDLLNSIRHSIPFDDAEGDQIEMDLYIGLID